MKELYKAVDRKNFTKLEMMAYAKYEENKRSTRDRDYFLRKESKAEGRESGRK